MTALHSKATAVVAALCLLATACATDGAPATSTPDATTTTGATYYKTALPVFAARCNQCHTKGGPAPFALDDYPTAKSFAVASLAAVEAKRMPPWMPSSACRHYADERSIAAEEVKALKDWVAAKSPAGDPLDFKAPANSQPKAQGVPNRNPEWKLQSPEPYTADAKLNDDYRCFVVGPEIKQETWIQASRVTPGDTASVHHVILYLIGPSAAGHIPKTDAATPGVGWTCFGGPGLNPAQNVGGWVPGTIPQNNGDFAGIRVAPGSRLVLQVHYNTLGHKPVADQTLVEVWLHPTAPANLLSIRPLVDFGIQIAAGDANSVHSKELENNSTKPWTIVGVMAHMHQLGKQISVVKKAAPKDVCLVDIERWDFNWQQGYRFLPGEQVTVKPGEKLVLQCAYDNSAAHQPTVNGVQSPPKAVAWGEGTGDEMCLAYVTLMEPYTELPISAGTDAICNGVQSCYDSCRTGGTSQVLCGLQCAAKTGGKCVGCLMPGIITCAAQNGCSSQSQALIDCFSACEKDPVGFQNCAVSKCMAGVLQFDSCASPLLTTTGICYGEGASCGVAF
ncbi:MAG: hypothetical protein EXR77_14670 [Myxococcales bacterium]|nr:hypothetical protein [Myxococcales bacterium]